MSKTTFNYGGIIATADTNSKYRRLSSAESGQYYITLDCNREIGGAFFNRPARDKLIEWLNGLTFEEADIAEGKDESNPEPKGAATDTVQPVIWHKFRTRDGDEVVITGKGRNDGGNNYPFVASNGDRYTVKGEEFLTMESAGDLVEDLGPVEPDKDATAKAIAALTKRVEALEAKPEPKPEPITMRVGEYYVRDDGLVVKCVNDDGEDTLNMELATPVNDPSDYCNTDGSNAGEDYTNRIVRVATPAERAEFELKREW